jgi:hypothetical protein
METGAMLTGATQEMQLLPVQGQTLGTVCRLHFSQQATCLNFTA